MQNLKQEILNVNHKLNKLTTDFRTLMDVELPKMREEFDKKIKNLEEQIKKT